eukprot:GHVS01070073.1.p1 GENE.GHVS01070073.1~~GHVS01070073.1.p1  ORF type:complete len:126 (+),score=14.95 GHVS01070073.1:128-505(+)
MQIAFKSTEFQFSWKDKKGLIVINLHYRNGKQMFTFKATVTKGTPLTALLPAHWQLNDITIQHPRSVTRSPLNGWDDLKRDVFTTQTEQRKIVEIEEIKPAMSSYVLWVLGSTMEYQFTCSLKKP